MLCGCGAQAPRHGRAKRVQGMTTPLSGKQRHSDPVGAPPVGEQKDARDDSEMKDGEVNYRVLRWKVRSLAVHAVPATS